MLIFRSAIKFFKTWFLPVPAHDDEQGTPLFGWQNTAKQTATTDSEWKEPSPLPPAESSAQASYAIPPIPAAAVATEDTVDTPAKPEKDGADSTSPDFSHLVKAPEAADMRFSRRRMEGADPAAFE